MNPNKTPNPRRIKAAPVKAWAVVSDARFRTAFIEKQTAIDCASNITRIPWTEDDKTARVQPCLITVLPKRK